MSGKDINDFNILIERIKKGDQSAYEEVYKRCYGHITFICSKLYDNKEDIEEIVQDTFIGAFKKVDELKGDTFLALLRKIAARRCYDKYKSRKRQNEYIVYSDDISESEAVELDKDFLPEEYLQNKEFQKDLLTIINGLPPKQREMIYLYYYADINTEEIAKLNNCPSVNVRKTLHTARNTIKSKMEGKVKAKQVHGIAVVSLASVLLMEEQAFAAQYVGASIPAISDAAIKVIGQSAKSSSVYAITAGTVAVVVISVAVILAQLPSYETYVPQEPMGLIITPVPYAPTEAIVLETLEPAKEEPEEEPQEVSEEIVNDMYKDIILEEAYEIPDYPETADDELEEVNPPLEPLVEEPDETEEDEEPEPEEEQVPVDRTVDILAALRVAGTREEVDRIIMYYGFSLVSQMIDSEGNHFWFHVLDDGSGDILIGTSVYEDGSPEVDEWRMKFEHYNNGQRPLDRLALFNWLKM